MTTTTLLFLFTRLNLLKGELTPKLPRKFLVFPREIEIQNSTHDGLQRDIAPEFFRTATLASKGFAEGQRKTAAAKEVTSSGISSGDLYCSL